MVAFEKWLVREYEKILPKSPIGKAIKYTYDTYHRLTRYHLDGRYRIDNNLAENSLRGLALGRKNYLFAVTMTLPRMLQSCTHYWGAARQPM